MWKMSETIGRIGSTMRKLHALLGFSRISGEEREFDAPSYSSSSLALGEFRPQTFTLAKQRVHEIDTQEALIIKVSRHDSGKAGGPL